MRLRASGSGPIPGVFLALAATVAIAVGTTRLLPSPPGQGGFPHDVHAGLFPACEACHAGIPEARTEAYYSVTPADCASCHDGVRRAEVQWHPPPAPRASNLDFTHPAHRLALHQAGVGALECSECHAVPRAPHRMAVQAATAEACLGCHAHEAPTHLAEGVRCADCHVRLAEAEALPTARIAGFPAPPDHEDADFIWRHGGGAEAELARCAVCHAQESCARCHLNADRLPAIAELSPDGRVAALVSDDPGRWPVPPSHRQSDWLLAHGVAARADVQACANCHAAPSCEACHAEGRLPAIAALPRPGPGDPSGVRVRVARPPGHPADFRRNHGAAAAADLPSCASCHTERECASCHVVAEGRGAAPYGLAAGAGEPATEPRASASGRPPFLLVAHVPSSSLPTRFEAPGGGWRHATPVPAPSAADTVRAADRGLEGREADRPARRSPQSPEEGGFTGGGFHPPNFVLRHGAEAFAARVECAECHSREAFCRDCHASMGMSAEGGLITGAFHDGQPDWLLAHGRAARQNMEMCASCHQQTSCLRCHSARAGWGVNPHGPGFDPGRVGDRSRMSCGMCHFASQLDPS